MSNTRRAFLKSAALGTAPVVAAPQLLLPRIGLRSGRMQPGVISASQQQKLADQAAWAAANPFYCGPLGSIDTAGNLLVNCESGVTVSVVHTPDTLVWRNGHVYQLAEANGASSFMGAGDRLWIGAALSSAGLPTAKKIWVNMGWAKGVVVEASGGTYQVQTRFDGTKVATVTPTTVIDTDEPAVGRWAEFLGTKDPSTGNVQATLVLA